jgi:hypothetical protein
VDLGSLRSGLAEGILFQPKVPLDQCCRNEARLLFKEGEDLVEDVGCGALSVGPGYSNNRNGPGWRVVQASRERAESEPTVGHLNVNDIIPQVVRLGHSLTNDRPGAPIDRGLDELVAVDVNSREGYKEGLFVGVPGVVDDTRNQGVRRASGVGDRQLFEKARETHLHHSGVS